MNISDKCKYAKTHEWIRIDGDEAFVGISDFAQEELGDVVYIELPEVDDELSPGEECGMIDSAKTTSAIYSPITGTVSKINENLKDHPELINSSPFDDGWMFAVKKDDPFEIDHLMDPKQYAAFIEEEKAKH